MLRSINGHLKALHKIKATSSTLLQVIFTTMNCWLDFLLRSCSLIKGGILVTGCSRTHSAVTLGDWSDPLDPDVETQMIFKQLLQGRDKLRKKYLEQEEADQTSSNKEKRINPDIHPDGAECNAQQMKPGQSVAARLLVVIEDLEQAHATFQLREKEDATRVILNP
ncbi:PREDICTED: rasGAP-activating-like protein 1 [Cyprinodon variegatus]|uniref:rasGAP-activating-like protein 1 n=1 Tax=Cyprinodon variegatus TaxID=28743 RepID=UPI0007428558|nr:PREDICTED: rasGAP-activating-like protein 1 [Cyprinodon variegatus]